MSQPKRRMRPVMTPYERSRIIGFRAMQIDRGALPFVEQREGEDALTVAEREFELERIPFIIRRYLTNGTYEDWKFQELGNVDKRDNRNKRDI